MQRLLDPHLTPHGCLFPHRSPRQSSANAAEGSLKPPPEGRLRRAISPSSLVQHRVQSHCYLTRPPALVAHRLFSGTRAPSSVPGFPARARAAARAHSRLAAALRRHAHGGRRSPKLPSVPSLIPSSFATRAIGRDVSITIFTASSLNSGEKLFFGRGNYFTFPDVHPIGWTVRKLRGTPCGEPVILGGQGLHGVRAERIALPGAKQRVLGCSVAFAQPSAHGGDGRGFERGAALFSAFPDDVHVGAGR